MKTRKQLKTNKTMAFYKKEFNEKFGVYYPKAVTVGNPVDTKKIAERLAAISTVSKADVAAVLAELPGVLADYMSQGKSVRLDGLGTFRYTLDTRGVEQEADFNFKKQLKAVRVQFTPQKEGGTTRGSSATRALVPPGIEWQEWLGKAEEASDSDDTGGSDDGEL